MENKPLVSICCTTYNHEKFIAQAIEGFLLQQTDFEFEIVIGEDCSTDLTAQIIKEYERKYPNKFRVYYNSPNIGVTPNWKQTLDACKGEFIAICEGYDYWTDPQKLSKQVSFLQNNPDFAICFHDTLILNQQTNDFSDDVRLKMIPNVTTIEDLANGHYMHSHTLMVRNNALAMNEFNNIISPIADYPFCMIHAKHGKIMKLSDVMAVYRIHSGGVWSRINIEQRTSQSIAMLDAMVSFFNTTIQEKITQQKNKTLYHLFEHYIDYSLYANAEGIFETIAKGPHLQEAKEKIFKRIDYLNKEVISFKNSRYFKIKNSILFRIIGIITSPFHLVKSGIISIQEKIQQIENNFFQFTRVTDTLETIHYITKQPYKTLTTEKFPPKVRESFDEYNQDEYTEYVYKYNITCVIEPEYGWIMLPNRKILIESFSYSKFFDAPLYTKYRKAKKKKIHYDSVINLRYYFQNYWHFVHDVCGQITLLDNLGIDISIPVIVPHTVLQTPYIKEIFALHPQLQRRNWVMHPLDSVIIANEVYLPQQMRHKKEYFDTFLNTIQFKIPISNNEFKIFVTRSQKRWRALINKNEIENIALNYGYIIVESEDLSVLKQFEIFSKATHIIGIHGAGLTNCIFRKGQKLEILEIFPSDGIPPHYYWLANDYGFTYDVIIGETSDENRHFYLNPEKFKQKLNK